MKEFNINEVLTLKNSVNEKDVEAVGKNLPERLEVEPWGENSLHIEGWDIPASELMAGLSGLAKLVEEGSEFILNNDLGETYKLVCDEGKFKIYKGRIIYDAVQDIV